MTTETCQHCQTNPADTTGVCRECDECFTAEHVAEQRAAMERATATPTRCEVLALRARAALADVKARRPGKWTTWAPEARKLRAQALILEQVA